MGQDSPVRGTAKGTHAGQQGGLEPTPVLVGAFEIEIGRRLQGIPLPQDAGVGDPRVKPDVQGIGHLVIHLGILTQQTLWLQLKPGIDTPGRNQLCHSFNEFTGPGMQFAGLAVHKQGDRYAPGALPGNTPVRTLSQHGVDARPAPFRHPVNPVHRLLGTRQQTVLGHADEPLGRGTENDRGLVTPAMGVAVLIGQVGQQSAQGFQLRYDFIIGFKNVLARQHRGVGPIDTVGTHRVVDIDAILTSNLEIFQTVGWRSVDAAGARIGGDMAAQHQWHFQITKGWAHREMLQMATPGHCQGDRLFNAITIGTGSQQLTGHNHGPFAYLQQDIVKIRADTHTAVGCQCPGRGGPDSDINRQVSLPVKGCPESGAVNRGKRHIHRRGDLVLVFNLCLGEGGTTVQTPVHRLEAFV